jgi:hypothetical protein
MKSEHYTKQFNCERVMMEGEVRDYYWQVAQPSRALV